MVPPSAIDIPAVSGTEAAVAVTVKSIVAQRARKPKLVAGVAAWCSSDQFKTSTKSKPLAKRWDHYISKESASRNTSALKGLAKYLVAPDIISLGGGLPCPEYFPFTRIEARVPVAPHFAEADVASTGTTIGAGKYDLSAGGTYDLSTALNYGLGTGSAQLIRFVTEHTELVCNPPYADWQCALSVGSTSALDQTYRIFCESGDYIMSEEFTFSSAMETVFPLGVKCLGIKMDSQGLLPEDMDKILSNWDAKARGARKPFVLYTVPSGQNPTGATMSTERRKEVYKVCQKHDVYIIEDEPYYFLQMQPYTGQNAPDAPAPASNEEFLKALVPTLLSMDIDGRVIRLDSFSKVIAPGTRVGWITASAQIVERFVMHNNCSTQNPSGISQILLYKLLDETWGHDGYLEWLINLRLEYTKRRDAMLAACEKFLPREVVSWNPPAAGMFLWMEIDWHKHPSAKTKNISEIEEEIFQSAIKEAVLVTPGSYFIAERDLVPSQMFFRATFAAASSERMAVAIERFGAAVRASFGLK